VIAMTDQETANRPVEVWAGVECTVNRVGEKFFDQLERGCHALRLKDIDRLADLRVSAVRYPVLWERTAPDGLERIDWTWSDERLERLRTLNVKPIVGLLHHGSGPRYTSLVDPDFPENIAAFAGAVAKRYPWVSTYTPINEPLTTARFSGLYGHWYPHARDARVFARALLLECKGIVLAMRAIRQINAEAKLLQTEDLGKTFSTPALAYQAEFENERRWLTYDLLAGRVVAGHPMWDYLCWVGIAEAELQWFADNPCPPDVIGINHYVTSERFLDERRWRYPKSLHGGNGRHEYADVEAVRVCAAGGAGPRALIEETWQRYGLPIAITEAHLGCTREEQLRWLKTIWEAAQDARRDRIDVRAVTAWAAFGAYDWNSLLTVDAGHYEPGLFDLRSPTPRPTALAGMVRTLAEGKEFDHPTLRSPGWWQRLERLFYPPVHHRHPAVASDRRLNMRGQSSPPLLITGATGTLGRAFARICEQRGLAYHLLTRGEMDIADPGAVASVVARFEPWAVVNAAGYVRVDDAENDRQRCLRENVIGPEVLANECAARDLPFVTFSSDLVFNGKVRRPYFEHDRPCPINVYGATKAKAEQVVLNVLPKALVIRTSAFFSPWDEHNFAHAVIKALARGETFLAANDATISPTFVPDLVNAALDLLIDGECGVWHLANPGALSWSDFARMIAGEAGYDRERVEGRPTTSFGLDARRPSYSALQSERGTLLPPLEDAVTRFVAAINESQAIEFEVPHQADLATFPAPDIANSARQRSRAATGSM
jgi:dTDP-4-dehydrorhamnose reductase